MVTIDLADELEIEDGGRRSRDRRRSGLGPGRRPMPADRRGLVPGAVPLGQENLVVRALSIVGRQRARAALKARPGRGGTRRRIRRRGGGASMGGSARSAVAARLGADVPFCVVGGRALVTGIGEVVEPLAFEAFTAVLLTPALAVSTLEVYRAWDELGGPGRRERERSRARRPRRRATLGLVAET